MLKKLLSYFIPVNVLKKKSAISQSLEITWNNGELVMDSANTNYSYGSLQRILRKGLKEIGFEKVARMKEILVLGVAGGSVVKILAYEVKTNAKIIGVEIDPEVVTLADLYFQLNQIPNFKIITADAFEYLLKSQKTFDLIIIDIFQDTMMPEFLFEDYFLDCIVKALDRGGYVLFNTMILNTAQERRNLDFRSRAAKRGLSIKTIPRVERHNEVMILHKPL
ncbi:MAG: methyltransferase domain-containing protein [Flavobacterium sp.]|nr:MAG: methyltransferase domain-containing protein [Flavobacterium sp.]